MRKPFEGSYSRTQGWNDACCRASYSQFGLLGHNGQDWGLPSGTKVLAPHSGIIKEITDEGSVGYGKYIKIENGDEGSVLAHLKEFKVSLNQLVSEGELVAISDNTGNSTGPHLHWGYYRTQTRNKNNGFNGYIDQEDWLRPNPVIITQPTNPLLIDRGLVVNELYTGILGTSASLDEIKSRIDQLNAGTALHDIVSQVLNDDGRSPLVSVKQQLKECLASPPNPPKPPQTPPGGTLPTPTIQWPPILVNLWNWFKRL